MTLIPTDDLSAEYALRQSFVSSMRRMARRLNNIEKAHSRIQYKVARMLIDEWNAGGYEGEISRDDFYCEASRVICDELGYALVSTTGETVKVWVEVFQRFENLNESLKKEMPFQFFRNARWLESKGYVTDGTAAILTALDHKLTANEMKRYYVGDSIPLPQVLEFRSAYPAPFWGLYGIVQSANGNREQIIWHITEIQRLSEDK